MNPLTWLVRLLEWFQGGWKRDKTKDE